MTWQLYYRSSVNTRSTLQAAMIEAGNPIWKLQCRRRLLGRLGRRKLTRAAAATLRAYLAAKPHARDLHHPGAAHRVQGWATSLTFAGRARGPSGSSLSEQHLPIDYGTDAAKPSANSKLNATPRPAASSTATGSKRETSDEISGRQTLHCHRWPQDQRQP